MAHAELDIEPVWKRALKVMEELAELDRAPNPVDLHVGARIRMRRKLLGVSQERLAEQLGLTFQQVQKYERGANRVSASKLYEIAKALQTSVAYFFDGLADTEGAVGTPADGAAEFMHELVMTPEGLELAALFPKLKRGRVRRRVLDLVKALAEEDDEAR
jgi:transcriptional regulator with XRE-family HTH domain